MIQKYPLDWYGLWEILNGNPHIRLSTDQVLKINPGFRTNKSGSFWLNCFNLKLLSETGWVVLDTQPASKTLYANENNINHNQAIHKLMQYAEYLFAGKQPGPEQSNTLPKWQFAKEI